MASSNSTSGMVSSSMKRKVKQAKKSLAAFLLIPALTAYIAMLLVSLDILAVIGLVFIGFLFIGLVAKGMDALIELK